MSAFNEKVADYKERMELAYEAAIEDNDLEAAWGALHEMMRFRLISPEDCKAEIKAHFKNQPKDYSDMYDYRNESSKDRLPDTFLFKAPGNSRLVVKSESHWVVRRELSFVGDQLAPDQLIGFIIGRAGTSASARLAMRMIEDTFKESMGKGMKSSWLQKAEEGNGVLYSIKLENNRSYKIKDLGGVFVTANEDTITIYPILDLKGMKREWIDVIDTFEEVERIFREELAKLGNEQNIVFKDVMNYMHFGADQRTNKPRLLTQAEMSAKRKAEYDYEKLANEAASLHITVEELKQRKAALGEEV
jgi:hypothetical protein